MSLRQELAVILMDHSDERPEQTYMDILNKLGAIPDHRDPIGAADGLPSPDLEPDDRVMAADESAIVWEALSQLPENYREPLVLFYREDQSVR